MLDILGLQPIAGRDLTVDDHRPGAARVVLVTSQLWRRLGGGAAPVGRVIQLNGEPYEIAGVLPPAARLPGTPAERPPPPARSCAPWRRASSVISLSAEGTVSRWCRSPNA
jgi:hypothetical protein